ncbi:BRO family protein [Methylobacterium sp.]|uniref:BRO family protein n=1 Tax=Methylobacterium sp. TaxID=409 RepID=UPI003B5CC2B6
METDNQSVVVTAAFDFDSQPVRSLQIADAPWFVGKDVCEALGHSNHRRALARLDDDERKGVTIGTPLGGPQTVTAISEAGVYQLLFTSRVDAAVRFRRWLAHVVLPALRAQQLQAVTKAQTMRPGTREFSDAVQAVREMRLLVGREAAKALWQDLGLPEAREPAREAAVATPSPMDGLVADFVAECIEPATGYSRESATDLWVAFQAWAVRRGADPVSQCAFGVALRPHCPVKRMIQGRWYYFCVSLSDGRQAG